MLIKVEQQDIDVGIENYYSALDPCDSCPVANAFLRQTNFKKVSVSGPCVELDGRLYDLPKNVAEWVHKFDCSMTGEPFEFELENVNA